MRRTVMVLALVSLAVGPATTVLAAADGQQRPAQAPAAAGKVLATVRLPQQVSADGSPLAAGRYQVRTTGEHPKAGAGQRTQSEEFVEFVQGGQVRGRAAAILVSPDELKQISEFSGPGEGRARVERLKGDDYVRVWIQSGGQHYLIHLRARTV